MKKRNNLLWIALLCFASSLIISCVKTGANTSNTGTNDSSAIFSATIAGANWTADSATAILVQGGDNPYKLANISGFTKDKLITITLHDTSSAASADSSIGVKQYTAGGWPVWAGFSYSAGKIFAGVDSLWNSHGLSYSGQASVTTDDAPNKKLSGTFSFTAVVLSRDSSSVTKDTVNITNGVFKNIPYSYRQHQ